MSLAIMLRVKRKMTKKARMLTFAKTRHIWPTFEIWFPWNSPNISVFANFSLTSSRLDIVALRPFRFRENNSNFAKKFSFIYILTKFSANVFTKRSCLVYCIHLCQFCPFKTFRKSQQFLFFANIFAGDFRKITCREKFAKMQRTTM
jgi:hypothetical protein